MSSGREQGAPLADQAWHGIEQVLDGTQSVFKLEYPCHSASQWRWFLLHVSRLNTADPHVVTTHLSITERKLTEQRLVVAERLAAVGEAMQGLSHEGRNALQRAQACLELLRLHVGPDAEALQLLEKIEAAQDHLLRVYEEVKSYAAPIVLRYETCQIDQLVQQACAALTERTPSVQVTNHCLPDGPGVELDGNAIRQVLELVFENAVASRRKDPWIEICCFDSELDITPAITLVVSDRGPGVPPEQWEKIFEPFYTTKTHGTGLGLAVCRRIISAHGGRIGLGPPRAGGTSVYLTLPRRRPAAEASGRPDPLR